MHSQFPSSFAARCLAIAFVTLVGLLPATAFGADAREEPVGLILSAGGSKLLRANTETPLNARDGDMLFSGDGIRTEGNPASFLFCPAKAIETLTASGEVRFEAAQPKVKTGKLSQQPVRACALPPTLRVAVASQQHVGSTMTRGVSAVEAPPIPRDKLPADVLAELPPADSLDPAALSAAATVFEKHNLNANALDTYSKLHALWPDAVWVKEKIFSIEDALATQASAAAASAPAGQTYALLVGISKYKRAELNLEFANADAVEFSKFLQSPRGGGVSPQNVILLTDENATTAAIRNGFQDLLKRRAGKNDTVILLVAGHGTVEVPGNKGAFIVTYDSDPQDLTSTALPMNELRALFETQLKNVGHVLLLADVCKAGTIGSIHNTSVNSDVHNLGDDVEGSLFGILASGSKQVSIEGPQFGGGHGVFTYFLLKGLQGAADDNKDGFVDTGELSEYVEHQVFSATNHQQHPQHIGTDETLKVSDVGKPGIIMTWRILRDVRNGEPLYQASNAVPELEPQAAEAFDRFTSAIQAGRILPDQSDNAFDALKRLQPQLTADRYFEASNQLRIALENHAQEVLLSYLAGDQNPLNRQQFAQGARYMEAARTLTKESLFLEGREDFFEGRALLFDKKFPDAANYLEQSVRIDPGAAYAYNALGIAYLEQGEFEKAIPAFRDAFRRAQHWSYPLHNEALARVETGDYQSAIRLYQQAMRLTPTYSYLPYNLGLVYQRLNRRKDAEVAYRKAIALEPTSAEPYNALGTLKNSEGKPAEAEKLYRDALQRKPDSLPARHNLALLLASQPNRRTEAVDQFRQNLTQSPDYLPSRLSLAQTLADAGDRAGAIEEYRRVLALKPGYTGARLALADLLAKSGDADGAVTELHNASQADPSNFAIFEQIGDIEASRSRPAEARSAYNSALNAVSDHAARKRIEGKIKGLH